MHVTDIGVIGGGPAGLAAAMWAARYRRSVIVLDSGQQRNRDVARSHGYLGLDGISPRQMLQRMGADVRRYAEVEVRDGCRVTDVRRVDGGFDLRLEGAEPVRVLRLVLATGMRDELPEIQGLDRCFGSSVFTCPSCDGYEARDRHVVVLSAGEHLGALAVSLLDWARTVTVLVPPGSDALDARPERLGDVGVRVLRGEPAAFVTDRGRLVAVRLSDGVELRCDVAFLAARHVQASSIAASLGCALSAEGCVVVDEHGATTAEHVYAAGDMTPGPHLVQVAAAEGAIAGISAATSLRGSAGAPDTPVPAPDPERTVH